MSDCGVPASRLLGDITRYLGVAQTSSLTHAQRHQPVTGISQDSRSVRPGDLYIALPGRTHHGGAFAAEAAARGAVAMISDRSTEALPSIVIDEPRRMLGPLAAWFHQEPSRSLDVYAVTGTNGKTSTAYLLDAGLVGAGHLTGMISGVDVRGPDGSRTAHRTTPEASEVQRTLAGFVQGKVRTVTMEVVTMEVSSHACRYVDTMDEVGRRTGAESSARSQLVVLAVLARTGAGSGSTGAPMLLPTKPDRMRAVTEKSSPLGAS